MWVPVAAPWASWGPLAISLACPLPHMVWPRVCSQETISTPQPSCLQALPSFPLVPSGVPFPSDPTWGVCVCVFVCAHACTQTLECARAHTGTPGERAPLGGGGQGPPGSQGCAFPRTPVGRRRPGLGSRTPPRSCSLRSPVGSARPCLSCPQFAERPRRAWRTDVRAVAQRGRGSQLWGGRGTGAPGGEGLPPATNARRRPVDPAQAHADRPTAHVRARTSHRASPRGTHCSASAFPRLPCLLREPHPSWGGEDD